MRRAASRPRRARSGRSSRRSARAALVRRPESGGAAYAGRSCRARSGSDAASAASVPSGQRICGPAMPHRGCASAKRDERWRRRPAPRTASGFETSTYSPARRGDAEVDVRRERQRTRVLEHAHAGRDLVEPSPGRSRPRASRRPAATSAGSERSSSAAWPCETTTAETFTSRAPPGRPRASLRRRLPAERARALEPRRRRAARARRARGGSRRRAAPPRRTTAASPATSSERRVGDGDDRRPGRHRLEHGQPEALVPATTGRGTPRRDRARRAAPSRRSPRAGRRAGAAPPRAPRPSPARRRRAGARRVRGLERGELVLPPLDRSHREDVVVRPSIPGVNAGIDAVRRHDDPLRRSTP